jgi:NTE family protein
MQKYIFKNLVFEGAGTVGTAYAGAIQVLYKHAIIENITRVAGASSGSIAALFLGLNYSADEVVENLLKVDFEKFLEKPPFIDKIPFFLEYYGRYRGDTLYEWAQTNVAAKTGSKTSTFADIQKMKQEKGFKDMYIVGSNLSTGFGEIFSHETTPDMPVADALRISMSYPLLFAAVRAKNGDVYVDGGLLNNYPVTMFDKPKYLHNSSHCCEIDRYNSHNLKIHLDNKEKLVCNRETLGFRIGSEQEIGILNHHDNPPHHKIDGIFSYLERFAKSVITLQYTTYLHSDDYKRTVYIKDLGVEHENFNISDQQKKKLAESGRRTTEDYLKSHQAQT